MSKVMFNIFLLSLVMLLQTEAQDDDLFNYIGTDEANRNFGPEDWDQVGCDNVGVCTGWPEPWLTGQAWELFRNDCLWCPKGNSNCGAHHQSPIELRREVADENSNKFNLCLDQHWMKYEDSSCSFDQLKDSFTIERYGLKVAQPIEYNPTLFQELGFRIACPAPGGRKFGRIDFSWGFNSWWFLSDIIIKMPSEHVQNGKRYTAEVQHAHFFSVPKAQAREPNEMATVSVFLEASDDYPPYEHLDRMICQWRKAEASTRNQCGLDPVETSYPVCFDESEPSSRKRRVTIDQALRGHEGPVYLEDINYRPSDTTEEEYAQWIQDYSEGKRGLMEEDHLNFHNYQFMIDCKTEYYHRYQGQMTIPPCYAKPSTLDIYRRTNHWRVMKDPVRIHTRQAEEMNRLLRERIAEPDDVHKPCQPDTAAFVDFDGNVSVARPLQETNTNIHDPVFCWCPIWPSKWPEDREWCQLAKDFGDAHVLYDKPYNFEGTFQS